MNTATLTSEVVDAIRACESALRLRQDSLIEENHERLRENLRAIDGAHSGSWLGYHSCVYYRDFMLPAPGDHFSSEWGFRRIASSRTSGNWLEYPPELVEAVAKEGLDPLFEERFEDISRRAKETFEDAHGTTLTVIEVLSQQSQAATLERLRDEIAKLTGQISVASVIERMRPTGSILTRDSTAVGQGLRCPPHSAISAKFVSLSSPFLALESLIKAGKSLLRYMEIHEMADRGATTKAGKIFIGHGSSPLWRELKDFLQDRLRLPWDEFNREPIAGVATAARLEQMLDHAAFAFLVLTAEDEHRDRSLHARENVIHEMGLFQGRLGFSKAIALLEDGCTEFSNIVGLGQIRFPKGDIRAKFEEVRRVLEREGLA